MSFGEIPGRSAATRTIEVLIGLSILCSGAPVPSRGDEDVLRIASKGCRQLPRRCVRDDAMALRGADRVQRAPRSHRERYLGETAALS